jgi:hypothetical protein
MQITYQTEEFKARLENALSVFQKLAEEEETNYSIAQAAVEKLEEEIVDFITQQVEDLKPALISALKLTETINSKKIPKSCLFGLLKWEEDEEVYQEVFDQKDFNTLVVYPIAKRLKEKYSYLPGVIGLVQERHLNNCSGLAFWEYKNNGYNYIGFSFSKMIEGMGLENIDTQWAVLGLTYPQYNLYFSKTAELISNYLFKISGCQQTITIDSEDPIWDHLKYVEQTLPSRRKQDA